jgi:hypothetical protein
MAIDEGFTRQLISTTTMTSAFKTSINIVDVAKYLPLDDVIIGVKLVYAGGSSTIIRGVAKISKKRKDFYNQVTFSIRLPMEWEELMRVCPPKNNRILNPDEHHHSIIVSCKIFHNGTLHVTGTHTLQESERASNLLLERLEAFAGVRMVGLIKNVPYLGSKDNLLFSSKGAIIGWSDGKQIYIKNEYVNLDHLLFSDDSEPIPVFVSRKWVANKKNIYTMEGEYIGNKKLAFDTDISKRHFEVKYSYIYANNRIVGKELMDYVPGYGEMIARAEEKRKYFLEKGGVLHCFTSFEKGFVNSRFTEADFAVHMINTYFQGPFRVCRIKLHKCFLDNGYYSRFDPCSNAAVNLRFHYDANTCNDEEKCGKCQSPSRNKRRCNCKEISASIFCSNRINLTGLADMEQGRVVYDFLKRFLLEHRGEIEGQGN